MIHQCYQTLGVSSSLRACSLYGEGDEETVYFGGTESFHLIVSKTKSLIPQVGLICGIVLYIRLCFSLDFTYYL